MTVTVKDLWKFNMTTKIYGYCTCGREVCKDEHTVCPMCGAKLTWNQNAKIREIYLQM